MDENPWGASEPSPHPPGSDDGVRTETQRVSFEASDGEEDSPAWGTAESPAPLAAARDEEGEDEVTADSDDEDEGERAAPPEAGQDDTDGAAQGPAEGEPALAAPAEPAAPDSPPPNDAGSPDQPAAPASPDSHEDEEVSLPPPVPPTHAQQPYEPPPMDDFDANTDDDEPAPTTPAPAAASDAPADDEFDAPVSTEAANEEEGDEFDDFGEVGGAGAGADGGEDDFGDFGDFGEADPSAFEPVPAPAPAPAPAPTPVPVASTSGHPPLRLDLSTPTRRAVAPQLREFFEQAWPRAALAVNDEPERQVEGPAQVLVTESSRSLLAELETLPALRPLDWRRSRVRREHLVAMGIPVNLDESEPKVSALSLSASSFNPNRPSSVPPIGGSLPFSSSPAGSRSVTPSSRFGGPGFQPASTAPSAPPPLDRARAEALLAYSEEDLTLLPLQKLQALSDEMERISVDASGVLTHALMMREKEGQDKEVYNGMIQDLVVAAAKMKTSSAGASNPPKRQGSGRWKLGSSGGK